MHWKYHLSWCISGCGNGENPSHHLLSIFSFFLLVFLLRLETHTTTKNPIGLIDDMDLDHQHQYKCSGLGNRLSESISNLYLDRTTLQPTTMHINGSRSKLEYLSDI